MGLKYSPIAAVKKFRFRSFDSSESIYGVMPRERDDCLCEPLVLGVGTISMISHFTPRGGKADVQSMDGYGSGFRRVWNPQKPLQQSPSINRSLIDSIMKRKMISKCR